MLTENKFSKYLLYAIGEIVLVVIGILIALQINNNNEGRKNEKNIIENLKTIQQELLLDINKSSEVIALYIKKDSLICRVLNSEVSIIDYKKNSQYTTLITRNFLLKTHENGFKKLEEKIDVLPEKFKELFKNLNTIYLEDIPTIEMRNQWMVDYALSIKNNYVKNYEWYLSYQDEINDDGIDYFMKDAFHKNNVARYRDLLIGNLLGSLQDFRENAITSYNEISNFLQSDNGLLESTKNFNLKNKDLKKYAGKYVIPALGQIFVDVFAVENELYFKFNGQNPSIKLEPLTNSFFYINNRPQTIRFSEIDNGNFDIWTYYNCRYIKGEKLDK